MRRRHAIFERIHAQFWELMAQPEHFKQDGDEDTDDRSKELRTERDHQLEAVLGANWQRDAGPSPLPVYDYQPTLSFLPEEKQRRWSELDENFNQRQQEIYQKTRGNAAEQKAQLEAIAKGAGRGAPPTAHPGEFQEYTKRTSPQAGWAREPRRLRGDGGGVSRSQPVTGHHADQSDEPVQRAGPGPSWRGAIRHLPAGAGPALCRAPRAGWAMSASNEYGGTPLPAARDRRATMRSGSFQSCPVGRGEADFVAR